MTSPPPPNQLSRLDRAFYLSLYLKIAFALVQVITGVLLLFLSPQFIGTHISVLNGLVHDHDHDDVIYRSIQTYLLHLTGSKIRFAAIYLLADAIIKLILINEVFHKRYWAYIALIIVLSLFVVYQVYRISLSHSLPLTALTLFDIIVIYLSTKEYLRHQALKRLPNHSRPSALK